ncbi:MAG: arginine--tRNA ligase [Proteobacteria bacterium]|nr:arginine--tRNA ligase [Pseudomonadota bacterium]
MIKDIISDSLPQGAKLGTPPNAKMGDIAIELFQLAKERKTSPMAIAEKLRPSVETLDIVDSANVVGPYLNIKLNRSVVLQKIFESFKDGSVYKVNIGNNKSALIEHTSVNPNASPHVGRARGAVFGDCLSRLLRYVGFDLKVHYYVNDMGKQIGLLALACKDKQNVNFDDILDIYVKASAELKGNDKFEKEIFEYLKKFEEGDEQVKSEFNAIVDKCVKGQSDIFSKLNISYDSFDYESNFLHDEEINKLVAKIHQDDIAFIDEHDRLVVDLKKIGFDREEGRYYVVKRSNGSTLYGYRDLAYNIYKYRLASEKGTNFVVLGEDHKLYFEQISLLLNHFGYDAPEVAHYSFIALKEGKMSTRQGNLVLLKDFIEEVKLRVAKKFSKSNYDEEIINKIATGVVRFNIIKVKPNAGITFDWDSAVSLEGDSSPYVQYTAVRASKIVKDSDGFEYNGDFSEVPDHMWELAKSISEFAEQIEDAYNRRSPARIAQYLIDLCQKYNSFYGNTMILKNEDDSVKFMGIQLCKMTAETIEKGLGILGIEVPDYM